MIEIEEDGMNSDTVETIKDYQTPKQLSSSSRSNSSSSGKKSVTEDMNQFLLAQAEARRIRHEENIGLLKEREKRKFEELELQKQQLELRKLELEAKQRKEEDEHEQRKLERMMIMKFLEDSKK